MACIKCKKFYDYSGCDNCSSNICQNCAPEIKLYCTNCDEYLCEKCSNFHPKKHKLNSNINVKKDN